MATEPLPEIVPDLRISTDRCPHCGAPRRKVEQKTGGISRFMSAYWMITWVCGSYVLLLEQPRLSLSLPQFLHL